MEKDMVVHCCVLQVFCLFLVTNVYGTNPTSLTIPSFESSWYNIRAQNKDNTALKINHYLGEYPAFVDVQIKIPKNGKDFIFTGVGSAHRDDDTNNPYGGTVYIYNQIDIVLTFPLKNNDFETGGIAYTGSHKLYNGPSELEGPFMTGMVKVRAWRNSDMPKLQLNMSVYVDNGANSYREINHTLGFYPDIMSVRTHLANGYLSDAQGSVLESCLCHMGGVIYGYDHQKIRLWVRAGYATFTSVDGWAGSLPAFNNGSVEILAWTMDNFHRSFQKVFTVMKNCSTQSSLHFQEGLDLNNIFISTKVRISTGNSNNSGMEFNAVGSSMASGLNPYGGIVYAYTTDSIMFWIPKAEKGHLIYIGGIWGSGQQSESADVVDVNVVVYYLSDTRSSVTQTCALTMLTLSQVHEDTIENNKKGYRDCIKECKEEHMNTGDLEFGNPGTGESLKYLEECIKERCLQNLMGNKFNLDLNYYRKIPDAVHRQSTEYDLLNGDGQDF